MTAALSDIAIAYPAGHPRPDVAAPTLRPAPCREPPFDDELAISGIGPHDRPLPLNWQRAKGRSPRQHGHAPARGALPEPALWARRLLIGIIESAAGKRPLHQVAALLSAGVASGLGADFAREARAGRTHWTSAATVRSVRVSEPVEGVAELAATVATGRRVRAIAMRLEVRHERWCCTRLQLG